MTSYRLTNPSADLHCSANFFSYVVTAFDSLTSLKILPYYHRHSLVIMRTNVSQKLAELKIMCSHHSWSINKFTLCIRLCFQTVTRAEFCLYIHCYIPIYCLYIHFYIPIYCLYIHCHIPIYCLYIHCYIPIYCLYIHCYIPIYCLYLHCHIAIYSLLKLLLYQQRNRHLCCLSCYSPSLSLSHSVSSEIVCLSGNFTHPYKG